jgi:hypothetical protein
VQNRWNTSVKPRAPGCSDSLEATLCGCGLARRSQRRKVRKARAGRYGVAAASQPHEGVKSKLLDCKETFAFVSIERPKKQVRKRRLSKAIEMCINRLSFRNWNISIFHNDVFQPSSVSQFDKRQPVLIVAQLIVVGDFANR